MTLVSRPFFTTGNNTSTNTTVCATCGATLGVGSWPFCSGKPDDHLSVRQKMAQEGTPTIVYRNQEGKCWYPTGDMAKPPEGFSKVELHNTRERDKFEQEVGQLETARFRENVELQRRAWRDTIALQRDKLRELREMSPIGRLMADNIEKDIKEREARFDREARGEAGFHIEGNHYYGRGPTLDW